MDLDLNSILPIHDRDFKTSSGQWIAKVSSSKLSGDRLTYEIEFNGSSTRHLLLIVSHACLLVQKGHNEVFDEVGLWLSGNDGDGEIDTIQRFAARDRAALGARGSGVR